MHWNIIKHNKAKNSAVCSIKNTKNRINLISSPPSASEPLQNEILVYFMFSFIQDFRQSVKLLQTCSSSGLSLQGFPLSKPRLDPAVGQVRGAEQPQHLAQRPPVMGPECAGTRPQDFAGCSQDKWATAGNAHGSWCYLPEGRSVQSPPSPGTQHYELCCLAHTVSPALAIQGTKPQPGHVPLSSSPCLFQHSSPVRISILTFPSSLAWGHPGMLTLPTEMFTAWKITHSGMHLWEHISILQAWLKGKVPTELSRGNPWE